MGAFRNVLDPVHEDHSSLAEPLDDMQVMDDLVVDIQRRTEQLQCPLQAVDGHVHAGAEPPGVGENDLHCSSLYSHLSRAAADVTRQDRPREKPEIRNSKSETNSKSQ